MGDEDEIRAHRASGYGGSESSAGNPEAWNEDGIQGDVRERRDEVDFRSRILVAGHVEQSRGWTVDAQHEISDRKKNQRVPSRLESLSEEREKQRSARYQGDGHRGCRQGDPGGDPAQEILHIIAPTLRVKLGDLRRSEERRVGKSVDLGGRRIIKKKKNKRKA